MIHSLVQMQIVVLVYFKTKFLKTAALTSILTVGISSEFPVKNCHRSKETRIKAILANLYQIQVTQ